MLGKKIYICYYGNNGKKKRNGNKIPKSSNTCFSHNLDPFFVVICKICRKKAKLFLSKFIPALFSNIKLRY